MDTFSLAQLIRSNANKIEVVLTDKASAIDDYTILKIIDPVEITVKGKIRVHVELLEA